MSKQEVRTALERLIDEYTVRIKKAIEQEDWVLVEQFIEIRTSLIQMLHLDKEDIVNTDLPF